MAIERLDPFGVFRFNTNGSIFFNGSLDGNLTAKWGGFFYACGKLKTPKGYRPKPTYWVNNPTDCLKRATRYSNYPTDYLPKAVHSAKRVVS